MAAYDVLGNVVVMKFKREVSLAEKKRVARKFLVSNRSVTTVLEKTGKFSGRLRTQSSKFLAGINTKEVVYKENNCVFRFNVDSCYFSPRLASERKRVALMIKPKERVIVLFGGVAPFAIVIAKLSKSKDITSVELGCECTKYAKDNTKRNKVDDRVHIVGGDVRRSIDKELVKGKFDRVIMARPNLKDSFLDAGFKLAKKNSIVQYYGFYLGEDKPLLIELIKEQAKLARKKVRIQRIIPAGEVGTGKFRFRADIKIL